MSAPAGFHVIAGRELDGGRFLVAGDGEQIHVEVEGGPFRVQEAKAIREGLALAIDVAPEMRPAMPPPREDSYRGRRFR